MNKLGTFIGLLILLAGAFLVYYLFHGNLSRISQLQEEEIVTEVGVQVGKVSLSKLHGYISAYGRIRPDVGNNSRPPANVRITTSVEGIISEAACIEGQEVSMGDTLFHLDSRIAEVAVKKAQQAVKLAQQNLARQKELMQSKGTSEKLLQQAEYELAIANNELARTETELSLYQIRAPISGTIVRVLARPGEAVGVTDTLAELVDHKRLIVEFQVPLNEIRELKLGQKVRVETGNGVGESDSENRQVTGELTFIDSVIDPQSDTVLVRASVPTESGLRSGRFVKVRTVFSEKNNCLTVPEESLVTTIEGQTVISIIENGKAFQKVVQPGLRENGLVEVQGEGIHEGMQVVTVGAYGLPPETKVRIITE